MQLSATRPKRLAAWVIAAAAAMLAAGCALGPRIDERHTARAQGSRVQHIVLHYTVGAFDSALKTLTEGPVSSHYLVARDPPTVYRLVAEDRRAFHAGVSSWRGQTGLNASSIGIEIVNSGPLGPPLLAAEPPAWLPERWEPFPKTQIDAVIALVRDIMRRHDVKPHMVVGHSDIAPSRKMDPGPLFPWWRLHAAGLVPWPDDTQVAQALAQWQDQPLPDARWFQQRLAALGHAVPDHGQWDNPTRDVLVAFQTRWRPRLYNGRPDAETAAILQVVTTPGGLVMIHPDGSRVPYRY